MTLSRNKDKIEAYLTCNVFPDFVLLSSTTLFLPQVADDVEVNRNCDDNGHG